ncbi:MAG: hypothetical protein KJO11_01040 [Gemmatimonadetes bacterium]|nr:hypothetical protein [Gemmatimonadota bacterium]
MPARYTRDHPDYVLASGFMHWLPGYEPYKQMRQFFAGGYKIHLSATLSEAQRVADAVLPLLRDMQIYHKVRPDHASYEAMNAGRQQGKFITVYVGPLQEKFLSVAKELDALLTAHQFTPGPTPSARLGGHAQEEQRAGLSRMIFYTTSPDFEL